MRVKRRGKERKCETHCNCIKLLSKNHEVAMTVNLIASGRIQAGIHTINKTVNNYRGKTCMLS